MTELDSSLARGPPTYARQAWPVIALALSAIFCLMSGSSANANNQDELIIRPIKACLDANNVECASEAVKRCNGRTEIEIQDCLRRTRDVWQRLLEAQLKRLERQVPKFSSERSLKSWTSWVDEICAAKASAFEGGTMHSDIVVSCEMAEAEHFIRSMSDPE